MPDEQDKVAIAAESAKPNGMAFPLVIPLLHKPVIANGDETSELKFREPTGADIERIGNPVNLDFNNMVAGDRPKITFEAKAMTQMMAALAGVPPSTIRQMHPRDWNNVAWALANFFTPD